MLSDIEIADAATLQPIIPLAQEKLGIDADALVPYGHTKAKVALPYIDSLQDRPDGTLILMTAISPTPAGEGKTTTSVGLADALQQLGKKSMVALREPSMGPVFGMKGGAAGGGYAQVVPMTDINLHFTGDFAAIAKANPAGLGRTSEGDVAAPATITLREAMALVENDVTTIPEVVRTLFAS